METPYAIKKYILVDSIIHKIVTKTPKILDIGCATGEITFYLKNTDYTGVDIDKGNIEQMKKKGLKIIEADLSRNALKVKNQFDIILMLDILEHLVNPGAVIYNAKALCKKNGYLLISLPNDYNFFNKVRFLLNKNINIDPFDPFGHLHIFPIKTGKLFLENSNLEIVESYLLESTKPAIFGTSVPKLLAKISPNNFARGVLYLCRYK